jgi:multisubunit Na+/H+ antiporter MnhB subunit
VGAVMLLDPKLMQWIASVLLVLSGVQSLVVAARASMSGSLRSLSFLIALAAAGFGVYMMIILLGAKI